MKKTVKQICASVLTVVMLLSVVPTMEITATAATQSGTCGDNLTWTYSTATCKLVIDGTGAMYDYPLVDRPWETYEANIKSVVIGNGVTTIGDYAFDRCGSLTSVIIGNSVIIIGEGAFRNCDSLTSITIGNNVTTIERAVFYDCDSLTSVIIPESVTTIETVFYECDSLTSIEVDADNKYYSSDSFGVLYNKKKTELIQYPIGNKRTAFTIPDGVTTIGEGAFRNCTSLTSVTIPGGVTTIAGSAFYNCNSLTSVIIPDSVTTIGYRVFFACNSLTDVYYSGSEEEWNKIEIGDDNSALLRVTIHFKTTESNDVGDVNGDRKINSSDALSCLQHSVGKTKLTGSAFTAADVDKNGNINSADALKILQYSVGKIEKL